MAVSSGSTWPIRATALLAVEAVVAMVVAAEKGAMAAVVVVAATEATMVGS
jgi:hypothetical protein